MKLNPKVHHTVSSVTASHAPLVLPRKFGSLMPTAPKALLMRPVSGMYMKAKIRQTAEEGTTYGAKKAMRKNHRPRDTRAARIAATSGSRTRKGVVSSVNSAEC